MEKRRLGRTGHLSSVVALGAAGLAKVDAQAADTAARTMLARGVNHIDIAPTYGKTLAEQHLAPVLREHRESVFLGCKTQERTRTGAEADLHGSLSRLGTDRFDLYQLHAINDLAELDKVMAPGGAMECLFSAGEKGLTRYLGITSHGPQAPAVQLEALRRFPFDTVLLPVNFVQWADEQYRRDAAALLGLAASRDVGVIAIKALARQPWGERPRTSSTWYEPFTDETEIRSCVRFALSQPVTTLAASSDVGLWPHILNATDGLTPMTVVEQNALIATAGRYHSIF